MTGLGDVQKRVLADNTDLYVKPNIEPIAGITNTHAKKQDKPNKETKDDTMVSAANVYNPNADGFFKKAWGWGSSFLDILPKDSLKPVYIDSVIKTEPKVETTQETSILGAVEKKDLEPEDLEDIQKCMTAIDDLMKIILNPEKPRQGPFEFEDIVKLNYALYVSQEKSAIHNEKLMKFVNEQLSQYTAQEIQKMQDIIKDAEKTRMWNKFTDVANGIGLAATGVGLLATSGPIGAVIIVAAIGLTAEQYFDSPVRNMVADALSGGDEAKKEQIAGKIQLGLSLAITAFMIATFTYGAFAASVAPGVAPITNLATFIQRLRAGGQVVDTGAFVQNMSNNMKMVSGISSAAASVMTAYNKDLTDKDQAALKTIQNMISGGEYYSQLYMNEMKKFIEAFLKTYENMTLIAFKQRQDVSAILNNNR